MNNIKQVNGCTLKFFLGIILYFCSPCFSAGSSSEGTNPFNQFMNPQGGVNLFSGDVVFNFPLVNLPGVNGMSANVSLSYSSNINKNVRTKNDQAPTSWVGLGWNLGYGAIICRYEGHKKGRGIIKDYRWVSHEGVSQRIRRSEAGDFYLEKNPYWKVKQEGSGWILTDPSGRKYIYGFPSGNGVNYNWAEDNNAVQNNLIWRDFDAEPGFDWGNDYIGNGGIGGTPEKIAYKWDLAGIEDLYGNRIEFEYDTIGDILSSGGWTTPEGVFYTKASYIRKITASNGNYIVFYTNEKEPLEYLDPKRYKEEPDAYIEFFEKKYLDSIKVFMNGHFYRKFKFCYDFINIFPGEHYAKRLLKSIIKTDSKRKETDRTKFEYYDDIEEYKKGNDYNLGALKQIVNPKCGTTEYVYRKMVLNNTSSKREVGNNVGGLFEPASSGTSPIGDYNDIGVGTFENGSEYFVTSRNYKNIIVPPRWWSQIDIYMWTEYGWKRQVLPLYLFQGTWNLKIACGHEFFFLYVYEKEFVKGFFWDKYSKSWVEADTIINDTQHLLRFSNDFSISVGNGQFGIFRPNGGELWYGTYDVDKRKAWITNHRTILGDQDMALASSFLGNPPYYIEYLYNDRYEDCYLKVNTIGGRNRLQQKFTLDVSIDEIKGVYCGDKFFIAYVHKGEAFQSEYVMIYNWTGEKWVHKLSKRVRNGKYTSIRLSNDYFTIIKAKIIGTVEVYQFKIKSG